MVTAAVAIKRAQAARMSGCRYLYLFRDIPMAPWAAWRGSACLGRAGAFQAILLDAAAQEARPALVAGLTRLAGAGLRSGNSTGLEDMNGAQPVFHAGRPGGDGPICLRA